MNEELQKVLDDIQERYVEQQIDPELLYPYLKIKKYLTRDEVALILGQKTTTARIGELFSLLKPKSEGLLMVLQEYFSQNGPKSLFEFIQEKLENCGNKNLIWQPSNAMIHNSVPMDDAMIKVCKNLKLYYQQDLELVEKYWRQFDVEGVLNMDTFYNQHIVISTERHKQIQNEIKNFNDLFSTDFNRFIITADAGYGKSTFVHEIARQWIKGSMEWTKKFSILFLFRLTEIDESKASSLQSLLTKCLVKKDSLAADTWLEDGENLAQTIFIFDGLDELRQGFCKDVDQLIFGTDINLAHVVVTSRQCENLEKLKRVSCRKLYIELKGYTDEGVTIQLKKFSISPETLENDFKILLKVPLFNTIFCITRSDSTVICSNICSTIEKFIKFAINRYRKSNRHFTESDEEELLILLGQAAQHKFRFISNTTISYPDVTKQHLFHAISAGLIYMQRAPVDFVFAHQTIAEYCAAYFWFKKSPLVIKEYNLRSRADVQFANPENGTLRYTSVFSQFLSLFSSEFKMNLWQNFKDSVPIFDEYESLPKRIFNEGCILFWNHSINDQNTIIDKLVFSQKLDEDSKLELWYSSFEERKLFQNIATFKKLILFHCTFKISAGDFFKSYSNLQSLTLDRCKFKETETEELNSSHLVLEKLKITECDSTIETFLSYIIRYSTAIKDFNLFYSFEKYEKEQDRIFNEDNSDSISDIDDNTDGREIGWINELKKNKSLNFSVETFTFFSYWPKKLTNLFQTFENFKNLKSLTISITDRKLRSLEANALSNYFETGSKCLEEICLRFETVSNNNEQIMSNLVNLSGVTILELRKNLVASNTLHYLVEIFKNLKLEYCRLEYQDIFLNDDIVHSIKSCQTLKKCKFDLHYYTNEKNYELFKETLYQIDHELLII